MNVLTHTSISSLFLTYTTLSLTLILDLMCEPSCARNLKLIKHCSGWCFISTCHESDFLTFLLLLNYWLTHTSLPNTKSHLLRTQRCCKGITVTTRLVVVSEYLNNWKWGWTMIVERMNMNDNTRLDHCW
jgi:hypothetical protein